MSNPKIHYTMSQTKQLDGTISSDGQRTLQDVRDRWLLAVILIGAFGIRVWHITWGLPDVYEEAYPFHNAWAYWNWGQAGLRFNPHFFHYPALSFHIQFVVQVFHYAIGWLFGVYADLGAYKSAYTVDPTLFFTLARLTTALLDVGTVCVVFAIGKRLVGSLGGLIAATLVALNVLHVRQAQVVNVDTPMTFFLMLAFYAIVRVYDTGTTKWHILAGVTIGLAAATKYTAALLVLPLVAAFLLRASSVREVLRGLRNGELAGTIVLAALVFLQMNPYIVLDWPEFVRDFTFEQEHVQSGHLGLDPSRSTLADYSLNLLPTAVGWPLLVVAAVAAGALLWRRRREDLLLLVFPIVYFVMIAMWAMRADRYLLPLLPFLVILAVRGLAAFWDMVAASWHGSSRKLSFARGFVPLLVIIVLAPPVAGLLAYEKERARPDTRTVAREWILAHSPVGAAIAAAPLGLNLPLDRYLLLLIPFHPLQPEVTLPFYSTRWYSDLDLVVGSSFDYARYAQEPVKYRPFLAFYDSLRSTWRLAYSVKPEEHQSGPEIWIYRPPQRRTSGLFDSAMVRSLGQYGATPMALNFAGKLALILSARGRLDRSTQLLEYVVHADPRNLSGYRELASVLYERGKTVEALEAAESALGLNPNDPEMLAAKGKMLMDLQRTVEAEPIFRRALELDRLQEAAYLGLSELYALRGDKARQLTILKEYRAILPSGDNKARVVDGKIRQLGG